MSYNYMLDRMKRDLISLTLTINDLTESLRSKTGISEDEMTKLMKARETKLQSKYTLDNLMINIDRDHLKRQERIESLNLSIKNKEEAIQKRNDRTLKQNDIRERAQNESKDQNELKMREAYNIQTAWSHYFKKRMDKEMKHYAHTESAFQKMRACAGNSDVKEMVMKFLTREQTYS